MRSPYMALGTPLRQLLGALAGAGDDEVAELLRQRVADLDPELEPWIPLLGIPLRLDLSPTPETAGLSPELARPRLHSAVGRFLDLLLPDEPILAVIEDAHWLDEASSELLATRLSGQREAGRAVILTRRDVAEGLRMSDAPEAVTLEIGPLDADEAARLILEAAEEERLPAPVREALLDRAQGNPLMLGELLAAARAGQSLEELPESVESLMTARIDTLPRAERLLLREASVLGNRVDLGLLRELFGADERDTAAALARLDDFLLPEGPGMLRFRHDLLRVAAYQALSFRRRRELHGRTAEIVEARAEGDPEEQAELLALHFGAAARWPETWRYARVAGERALERAAPVEAAGFLESALQAAGRVRGLPPTQVASVAEALGDAAEISGRYEQAERAYGRARRLLRDDPMAQAELSLKEGRLREETRHLSQALRWYTLGLQRLEQAAGGTRAASLRARLLLAHGASRLRGGRLRECLPYLEQAVEGAKACGDRATLAHGYYLLDWAHTDLGSPDAHRFRDLALPMFEELGDHARQGRVLNNLGVDAYYEGRWEEAVDLYERSHRASQRAGDVVEAATALHNIAEIRLDQNRLDEAHELLTEALATWRAVGYGAGVGTALSNLGRVAAHRGDTERAAELLERAREQVTAIGAESLLLEAEAYDAERLLLAGEYPATLAVCQSARRRARRVGAAPGLPAMLERLSGCALLAQGGHAQGVALLREAAELARRANAPYEEALALEWLASEDPESANGTRERARELLERLGVIGAAPAPLSPSG
jgi:tetratricopeptide (TPR) repeat protein